MNGFLRDVSRVYHLLETWPGVWPALQQALRSQKPVLLVAEGSSRLFPGGLATMLARRWGVPGILHCVGGREAVHLDLQAFQVLLSSNSGRTREALECLSPQLPPPMALLGAGEGPVAQLGGPKRIVLDAPEEAIAATVSVYAQALTLAQALAEHTGQTCDLGRLQHGLGLVAGAPGLERAERMFWAGGEDGLSEELALKTAETTGCLGLACPGTMALHGVEEVWQAGDLIIDLGLGLRDADDLRRRADACGVPVHRLSALQEDVWAPFDRLVAGWHLLHEQAALRGRDPGQARRARKVGNGI